MALLLLPAHFHIRLRAIRDLVLRDDREYSGGGGVALRYLPGSWVTKYRRRSAASQKKSGNNHEAAHAETLENKPPE